MAESESFADVVELISSKLNVLNAKHASELDAEKSVAAVLREQLAQKGAELAQKDDELAQQREEIERLQSDLAQKDKELDAARKQQTEASPVNAGSAGTKRGAEAQEERKQKTQRVEEPAEAEMAAEADEEDEAEAEEGNESATTAEQDSEDKQPAQQGVGDETEGEDEAEPPQQAVGGNGVQEDKREDEAAAAAPAVPPAAPVAAGPAAVGGAATGSKPASLHEHDVPLLRQGAAAVHRIVQFALDDNTEAVLVLMADGRLLAFATAGAGLVPHSPETDQGRCLLGPLTGNADLAELSMGMTTSKSGHAVVIVARNGRLHYLKDGIEHVLERGCCDDIESEKLSIGDGETKLQRKRKKELEAEETFEHLIKVVQDERAGRFVPTGIAFCEQLTSNLIVIPGADGTVVAKQMCLDDDTFTNVVVADDLQEEQKGTHVLFLDSRDSNQDQFFAALVVATQREIKSYAIPESSLDPTGRAKKTKGQTDEDFKAEKERKKKERDDWIREATHDKRGEQLFKSSPDNSDTLPEDAGRLLLMHEAKAKQDSTQSGHNFVFLLFEGRAELWMAMPRIEKKESTEPMDDLCAACAIDWPLPNSSGEPRRHWLVASSDGTLHLLNSKLKRLHSYQLALADDAPETRPRLTALSLLSPGAVVKEEAEGAEQTLCVGFDDGSLRRFKVTDLGLGGVLASV